MAGALASGAAGAWSVCGWACVAAGAWSWAGCVSLCAKAGAVASRATNAVVVSNVFMVASPFPIGSTALAGASSWPCPVAKTHQGRLGSLETTRRENTAEDGPSKILVLRQDHQ